MKRAACSRSRPPPFLPDGRIDTASIDRLVEAYLACGADGVTVLGIMGEAPKLTPEESLDIAGRFIRGMGRAQTIVGVSARPASPPCGRWPGRRWTRGRRE